MLDHFINQVPSALDNINLYAITALLVAAKSTELDEKVPFVSKLLRVTGINFIVADIKAAELKICEAFNWHLQNSTLIDILEYFLTQGIIFSSDEFEEEGLCLNRADGANVLQERSGNSFSGFEALPSAKGRKIFGHDSNEKRCAGLEFDTSAKVERNMQIEGKLYEIISSIERRAFKLATLIIREAEFYEFDDIVLAAACIAFLRQLHGVAPVWNERLTNLTGVTEANLAGYLRILWRKFEFSFNIPTKQKSKHGSTAQNFGQFGHRNGTSSSTKENEVLQSTFTGGFKGDALKVDDMYSTGIGLSICTTTASSSRVGNNSLYHSSLMPLSVMDQNIKNSMVGPTVGKSAKKNPIFDHAHPQEPVRF
jgi:hypothetical protein